MNNTEFIEVTKVFFKECGGIITSLYYTKRKNIEIMEVIDQNDVDVYCFEVEFRNANIFGNSDYIEAYRRYRQMRTDWWSFLQKKGFEQWTEKTSIIGHFVPLLAESTEMAEPYLLQNNTSYGQKLTRYDQVSTNNEYYISINEKYGLKWLLQDGNGIVIGPDMGLFFGVMAYTKTFGKVGEFLDIGTGTGELSTYLIKNRLVDKITANEISDCLKTHIVEYLEEINKDGSVSIDYQFCDALDMVLPDKMDLLSIGIYYGAQPDFFKKHGKMIKRSLSKTGAVIIQSGMLEGKFNVSSIVGDDERLYKWNWYDKANTLTEYFPCITSVFVADEIITIAAHTNETIEKLKNTLFNEYNATEIPKLNRIVL